jgi:TonB family protein
VPLRRNVVARPGKRETVEVVLQAHEVPTPAPARQTVAERLDPNRIFLSREVDTPPRKVSGDTPDSSALPKLKGGEKLSVTVVFVVTESGEVGEVEVTESQAGEKFNELVVKTIRKWRFEAGIKAGVKVKVRETRKFTYQFG